MSCASRAAPAGFARSGPCSAAAPGSPPRGVQRVPRIDAGKHLGYAELPEYPPTVSYLAIDPKRARFAIADGDRVVMIAAGP